MKKDFADLEYVNPMMDENTIGALAYTKSIFPVTFKTFGRYRIDKKIKFRNIMSLLINPWWLIGSKRMRITVKG